MTRTDQIARLLRALGRAINEHGAPNTFAPAELFDYYGAPSPMQQGRIGAVLWPNADGWIVNGCRIGYKDRRWTATPVTP